MALLQTKWIAADAVTDAKLKLTNNGFLRGRNAADSADVNIVKVNTSNALEFGLLPYGPNSNAPIADAQLANKKYVDDQVASGVSAVEWQDSVFDKDTVTPPGSPSTGDRYLIGLDSGASAATGAWAGHDGKIAEYNGSIWVFTAPATGMMVAVDDEQTVLYLYSGTTWTSKSFESTTASLGLVKVGVDIRIDASAAGAGLTLSSGVLSVNVDGSSLEINSDTLRVKAAGITEAMLNSAVDAETFLIATGYNAAGASGNVTVGNTIQAALEKIEKKVDDVTANAVDVEVQVITLSGTNITNGYVDLAFEANGHELVSVFIKGSLPQVKGDDYTTALNGAITRLTFAGDLASLAVAGDKLVVSYLKA